MRVDDNMVRYKVYFGAKGCTVHTKKNYIARSQNGMVHTKNVIVQPENGTCLIFKMFTFTKGTDSRRRNQGRY